MSTAESKGKARFKLSADGKGIVSQAGTALLRELARIFDRIVRRFNRMPS